MTEIQIMNAMNQSVINKITEFKNKEIKKEDLNHFLFVNLSYILKQKQKIKARNEKISHFGSFLTSQIKHITSKKKRKNKLCDEQKSDYDVKNNA